MWLIFCYLKKDILAKLVKTLKISPLRKTIKHKIFTCEILIIEQDRSN